MRFWPCLFVCLLLSGCSGPTTPTEDPGANKGPASTRTVLHGFDGASMVPEDFAAEPPRFDALALDQVAWEPTIGITPQGAVFYGAHEWAVYDQVLGARTGQRVVAMRSTDGGAQWDATVPHVQGTRHHAGGDPYLHVDATTGRVFVSDLYAGCTMLSWSDDLGETWQTHPLACGWPVNDHQTVFTGPPPSGIQTDGYANLVFLCTNDFIGRVHCAASHDGGQTFDTAVVAFDRLGTPPADPATRSCTQFVKPEGPNAYSPVPNGHGASGPDGAAYLGVAHWGEVYVVRSLDGGDTWTEHRVDDTAGIIDEFNTDVQVAVDDAGVVAAFWIAQDGLPRIAWSTDDGEVWTSPHAVAPSELQRARFPAITAGDAGRFAWSYYGRNAGPDWHGFVGMSVDLLATPAAIATTQVTPDEAPVAKGACAGRCNEVGDFLDISHDPTTGHVWTAMVDVCLDPSCAPPDEGRALVGRQTGGLTLRAGTG